MRDWDCPTDLAVRIPGFHPGDPDSPAVVPEFSHCVKNNNNKMVYKIASEAFLTEPVFAQLLCLHQKHRKLFNPSRSPSLKKSSSLIQG